MNKRQQSPWVSKVIWLAGLVLIVFGKQYMDQEVLWRIAAMESGRIPFLWVNFLLPFAIGMYVSLLFVWSGFNVKDASLFFVVALPLFIAALMGPISQTVELPLSYNTFWIIQNYSQNQILPLVAGVLLLPSIPDRNKKKRR